MSPDSIERFWKNAFPEPMSGCWIWTGDHNEKDYGRFNNEKAHRIAWRLKNGPIPKGMHVLHKCDVRCCVNENHLFLGTHFENMQDRFRKGRYRRMDSCQRGHSLIGYNLKIKIIRGEMHRSCRECNNLSQRRIYHLKKNGT